MTTPYKPHVKVITPNPVHVRELATAFEHMRNKYMKKGITYSTTTQSRDSYVLMQDLYNKQRHIEVSTVGSDTAIYGLVANTAFRFWHDCVHCMLKRDFSFMGEQATINHQILELQNYGISEGAMNIFIADTLGQVLYYYEHKEFVKDQKRFITACLTQGTSKASRIRQ